MIAGSTYGRARKHHQLHTAITRAHVIASGNLAASGKLAVDGVIGPLTTRALQRWVGTTPNGALGRRTAKALQRKVGVTPDGVIGANTVRPLQTRIGARHDGARHLSSATVSALQAYLTKR